MNELSNGLLPLNYRVSNSVPRDDAQLGLVVAEGCDMTMRPPGLAARIDELVVQRAAGLDAVSEQTRLAARNLLRNGSYKPTGRGKPASEYLLRTALEGNFPRINGPVDCCNFISLSYMLPISLWDPGRIGATAFDFRLGSEGESYIFNQAGQTIDLRDLITGFIADRPSGADIPIVTPIKDSLMAKADSETRNVIACIYAPAAAVSITELEEVSAHMARLLQECGTAVSTATAVALPSQSVDLSPGPVPIA